jgi:ABC-type xylose transport system substrate-binding protein
MIADKVDLLLIAAIDGSTLSQTLGDAKSANIPVIAYDRLIMDTDAVSYYVSFDNYTVGKLQGEFVRDQLGLDSTDKTKHATQCTLQIRDDTFARRERNRRGTAVQPLPTEADNQ